MADQSALMNLVQAIARDDGTEVARLLAASPDLATAKVERGATRQDATDHWITEIEHYVYGGDTALHIAAAAHHPELVRVLLDAGADVGARNRRSAQPLHYAADGMPGSDHWDPDRQAGSVTALIAAGADPNAIDASGVAPLHRAVRTRCAAAVRALLDGGADGQQPNRSGSTPTDLATRTTGRGGSGSPEARAQQQEILQLLGP